MSDFIGPCLPPHLKKRKEEEVTDSLNQQPMIDVVSTSLSSGPDITSTKVDDTKNREYGPVIGPMLPSCLSEKDSEISGSEDGSVGLTEVSYGPLVPPSSQVSFGPALPPNMCSNEKDNLTSEKIGLNVSSVEEGMIMCVCDYVYMYMYVFMYVSMYTYMYMYVHVSGYMCLYMCMYV